jgi:putative two-component system protein, hydrogenase maturation factor HypX/HoxX
MRILFLTHSFNSLAQRLYAELIALGHEISVEFDIADSVTVEAVRLFRPDLILAPYLRRAIPESVWREHICLIVHPGIVGDRGPSALDWAILKGETEWGVTVLQAQAEMDAGPVWAAERFPMRAAKKSSLYRNEVTEAAVRAVTHALERYPEYRTGRWRPTVQDCDDPIVRGRFRPLMRQADRAIEWARDDTETVLRKVNSADGFPGVRDSLFGQTCHLYDAQPFDAVGAPGSMLGRAGDGVVRAALDGAVWIGHVRRADAEVPIKLPTVVAFPELVEVAEEKALSPIHYEEVDSVGYLHFALYNGAMGTTACERLREAFEAARRRPTRVIVLMGGPDFYGNGLDLNLIEAAASPADESWRNINAMDDLCRAILETNSHLTVSALQGNAGAGGAFLALAADYVWARSGVILNPHYKNMGNLYGSEYWTYSLPRRVGQDKAVQIMQRRLPLGAAEAVALGFIDAHLDGDATGFAAEVHRRAGEMAAAPEYPSRLADKRRRRAQDEAEKPLSAYRAEELTHMRRNFYGFDPSYHVARYHFVHKTPASWTPRHLALHRRQEPAVHE